MITRRRLLGSLLLADVPPRRAAGAADAPVEITIGEHRAVTIRFPNMDRASVVDLISTILIPAEKNSADMKRVLQGAGELTMIMTTEKPAPRSAK